MVWKTWKTKMVNHGKIMMIIWARQVFYFTQYMWEPCVNDGFVKLNTQLTGFPAFLLVSYFFVVPINLKILVVNFLFHFFVFFHVNCNIIGPQGVKSDMIMKK